MNTTYKDNWDEVYERFEKWWSCEPVDRPLIGVRAPRQNPLTNAPKPESPGLPDQWLDKDHVIRSNRWALDTTYFGGEAFPIVNANLGPGSLAIYLGSEPVFHPATVWYTPCIEDLETDSLPEYDPDNPWLRTHLELIRALHDDVGEDAYVAVPDIIESVDILAAMRDPMTFVYDLMDRPEACHRWLERINALYFPCYDRFYGIVKDEDGGSVFTAFLIWGPGKTVKVQCDFAAMMSPRLFDEFYVPYVTEQIEGLGRSLYHLDGPDCICHVDSLLGIEKLNAIQWVSGAGNPPMGDEIWFDMYDKILSAGKGLQLSVKADRVEPLIKRFGAQGLYLITGTRSEREADELLALAKRAS